MADDYANQNEFADNLIDSTLETLRDQEDDSQDQLLAGSIDINPQQFGVRNFPTDLSYLQGEARYLAERTLRDLGSGRQHMVLGPFTFETPFSARPTVTFGQTAVSSTEPTSQTVQATNYVPFLVDTYIFSYRYTNGEIDAFYLGVYAKTSPPLGLSKHIIDWHAKGKGSRYGNQGVAESWDTAYDYNEADYLNDEVDYEDTNEY